MPASTRTRSRGSLARWWARSTRCRRWSATWRYRRAAYRPRSTHAHHPHRRHCYRLAHLSRPRIARLQVEAARSRPAGGAGADARALYKVVARVEETLSDKFVQLEERIARAQAKAKARKLAEAAAAGAAAPAEGGGAGAAGAPAGQPQHRPTRTLDPDATAAAPPPGGNASLASMLSDPPQTVEC